MFRQPRPTPDTPAAGQESVWDYPRPAIAEASARHIRIELGGRVIANSRRPVRTLAPSHPPGYYIPPDDFDLDVLSPTRQRTLCEWKGQARYYDLVVGDRQIANAAWSYDAPTPAFESLKGFIAVFPSRMDACFVDDERVIPQAGQFYGGWITSHVAGPFKGEPGTQFW